MNLFMEKFVIISCDGAVSPSMAIQSSNSIARSLSSALNDALLQEVTGKYEKQAACYLHTATVLGSFLIERAAGSERCTSDQLAFVVEKFVQVLDRLTRPGYRVTLSPLWLPLYQSIRACEDGLRGEFLFPAEEIPRKTLFALRFPGRNPTEWTVTECQLFAEVSGDALYYEWHRDSEALMDLRHSLLRPLMDRMQACAERCLEIEEWSCLRWWLHVLSLLFSPCRDPLTSDLFPHGLIDVFVRCCDHAKLNSDGSASHITQNYLDELVHLSQRLLVAPEENQGSRPSIHTSQSSTQDVSCRQGASLRAG